MSLFLLIALLAVSGLAIDGGLLYRKSLQLQAAADASVLAGLGAAVLQREEYRQQADRALWIEEKAQEIARENLRLKGLGGAEPTARFAITDNGPTLEVEISGVVEHLLISRVPFSMLGIAGASPETPLRAEASGVLEPANVSLVLDYSDSMRCPSVGSCDCLTPDRNGSCADESQLVTQKYEELLFAVEVFLNIFDEERDRINLVSFNMAAAVDVPVRRSFVGQPTALGFNRSEMLDALRLLEAPQSSTNVCDGFMRAYEDMWDAGIAGEEEVAYVYFSDGAPTAGRFLFASPSGLPAHNPQGLGEYDYGHYLLTWVNEDDTNYPGPSFLVRSQALLRDHEGVAPPPPGTNGVGQPVPVCSGQGRESPPYDPALFDTVVDDCLVDAGFLTPDGQGPFSSGIGSSEAFGEAWRKLYYHCAVELSDFLRRNKSFVYVIGLGPAAAAGADPYQDINDNLSRKDVFLSRIANDRILYSTEGYPDFSYEGATAMSDMGPEGQARRGRYFPTPDAAELEALFSLIAKRILLRLIS